MKLLNKKYMYKMLIVAAIVVIVVNLFTFMVYGDGISRSIAVIVHEDPNQIQNIEITNYELKSFINSIEDKEKRALLYEISITPVKEEAREYIGDDSSLNSYSYISVDSIKGYKELAQLSIDELRKKLDEVKAMNATLIKNENMLFD